MDLRLIEYFLAVVDKGSITAAAKSLYVAQPSLSQAIRDMERELGAQLFDRSGRRATLTATGMALVPQARRIMLDAQALRETVAGVRDGTSGWLELAALSTLSMDPLPGLVRRFHDAHPGVTVTVRNADGLADLVQRVRLGENELGLTELPVEVAGVVSAPVLEQELVMVLPEWLGDRLPDPIPHYLIPGIPLVIASSGSDMRTHIDAIAAATGDPFIAVECSHRQALFELVKAGAGATLVPHSIAVAELGDQVIRALRPRVTRTVGMIHRDGPLSSAAASFLEISGISGISGITGITPPPAGRSPGRRARPGTAGSHRTAPRSRV